MAHINRPTTQARDAQAIVGIQKHLQNVQSLPLAGTVYTVPDLVKLLQRQIDSANACGVAKAAWMDAVKSDAVLGTQVTKVIHGLRSYVLNMFGVEAGPLADFGFAPPKKTVLTPAAKALAAEKLRATREARGTLGRKAKLKIKGVVPVPTVPAAPAAHASPAIPAGSAITGTIVVQPHVPEMPTATNGVSTPSSVNGAAHS